MNDLQAVTADAEPAVSRKLHAIGRKLGTPVSGTFELTAGCNFNCEMCYIHQKGAAPRKNGELTASDWLEIGRQAADAGTVFLLLTGGEPLLRPDFAEIYTGLKQLGLMVSVNTNGSLLRGDIARLFEKSPPVRLNLSLYADSPEGYLKQCGVPAYDTVIENIRRMRECGVDIKLNISFTQNNADRISQMEALTRELGLHCQVSFYMYPPVRRMDGSKNTARLSPAAAGIGRVNWEMIHSGQEGLTRSAKLIQALTQKECECAEAPTEGVRCRAGHTAYWVDHAGNMLMCGMIPKTGGNVLTEGFAACWQNTRNIMRSVKMPAKCTVCSLRPVCCVCPAACFSESGDFETAPPYLCEMSRAIAEKLDALQEEKNDV